VSKLKKSMMTSESLFTQVDLSSLQVRGLCALIQKERERVVQYEQEVSRLYEIIRELKRHRFGKRSERWESEEQVLLFNEAEVESKKPEPESDDVIEVKAHTKKRGHRKALPGDLPREIKEITLPAEEQFTQDGTPLKAIGYESSEKLKYEPAKLTVIEYRRIKYGVDSGDYVKTAPPVPSIIPKGIATPELLADVVTKKYADGLPLYRQEDIWRRHGIELPRQTLARWIVTSSEACRGVYNLLVDRLMENFYVSCDETHTQVLNEKGKPAESKSWMWVRATPFGKNKIVLFDYDPSRSGDVVTRLFADFKGYLQVDGYSGYNVLEKNAEIIELGCNMHGRRYFEKAKVTGAKAGQGLAETGLKFYKTLFDLEEEIRDKPPDERHQIRQQRAVPIWDEFKKWADENHSKVPPKSKIGEAFHYFRAQYDCLIGYLKDGRLEMDNGFVERAIRKFAIGRNNWLFSDTEAGAEASALFYSLVVTAKINGINPYEMLKTIFTEVPKAKTAEDLERLADVIMGIMPLN
jgi:transposase